MDFETGSLDKMLAAWNSSDAATIEQLATDALEHNVHFADPTHNIIGREAFVAMVHRTHKRVPGAVYSRASRIDVQNNFCRYHWEIHVENKLLLEGFDVTEINDAGKVVKVLGFFGKLEKDEDCKA
ncbi:nuclear transport factor 2 family protein [Parasphingorhabdus sp.]|uniref:nuclear transport factor 2 family protein n=1 Tax=Parasphingorhabdus sp. TaxID=2709688 RepID=UPI003D2DBC8D